MLLLLHIRITFGTQTILSYFVNFHSSLLHVNAGLPQNLATHLFNILPTTLFSNNPIIRRHALWTIASVVKQTLNEKNVFFFSLVLYVKISGYFMYRQVENLKNSTFCPQSAFRVVVTTNEIIPLYGINWMMFATEANCVYCAVRTPYLNIVNIISPLKGSAYTVSISEVGEPASLWAKWMQVFLLVS
jgi:hypothetical protein